MVTTTTNDEVLMEFALHEARQAAIRGEVPVGAVVVVDGQVVSQSGNTIEADCDASAHAEIIALRAAGRALDRWRLSEASLYVTLEPCIMCAMALRLFRVKRVVYGAPDERMGGLGTIIDVNNYPALGPVPEVVRGVRLEESREILRDFFRKRRAS